MTQETTRDIVLRMDGKLDAVIKQVTEHHADLNGNGRNGLKADVRDLKSDVSDIKRKHIDQDSFTRQVKLMTIERILVILGLAIALIFGLK